MSGEHFGLAWNFYVSPDSCDNPDYYHEYIALNALGDAKIGQAVTHIMIDEDAGKMAGYVALRASALIEDGEDGVRIGRPALEIAELAVSCDYERQGIGTELFNFAVLQADEMRRNCIGIRELIVCADPMAVGFYTRLGFAPAGSLYDIPRDGWNSQCTPMYITLPEL